MSEMKTEGITAKKDSDFDDWYAQVIIKSELADYSPVSGCLVFRPTGYAIWEKMQGVTDAQFKEVGIQNTYFPIFIPERLLRKEQEHVKGFSPEVAWVTQTGETKLEERLAVRPTSETIMYEVVKRWIRSWRDLPLRLNQWNNVVRWEFRHPTPFLRSREFLWNEGHTLFASEAEAMGERDQILGIYRMVTEDYLALPGLMGRKTESQKFAGAVATYSIEHILPDGKAIQGPDFHFDGQNFAKAFEIVFIDKNGQKQFAWQNTWAISTREIGVMLATHSDDRGLVIPPMLAPVQVVIVPIFDTKTKRRVIKEARKLSDKLAEGLTVRVDERDHLTPGRKFNEWELKGVPLRVEIGPRDLKKGEAVLARRDTLEKRSVKLSRIRSEVTAEIDSIQKNLLARASQFLRKNTHRVNTYADLKDVFARGGGIVQAPWCESSDCEESITKETGAKIINIPLKQKQQKTKCLFCGKDAKVIANFAKSY